MMSPFNFKEENLGPMSSCSVNTVYRSHGNGQCCPYVLLASVPLYPLPSDALSKLDVPHQAGADEQLRRPLVAADLSQGRGTGPVAATGPLDAAVDGLVYDSSI